MVYRKWMILPFVLFIVAGFIVTSMFVGGNSESVEKADNVNISEIVHVNFRDTRDLNPHLYGGEFFAQNLVFEGLVMITSEGIKPCLAKSWNISENGLVYTFYLREDVTFSDGYRWNAKVAEDNFRALHKNKDRHGWLESIRLTESFTAVEDYIFEIRLKKPYYPLLTDLGVTRPYRFISPNCFIDGNTKEGVNGYIGTGKYVITEHKIDQYTVFEINRNYWGELPEIKMITTKVIPDNQSRLMALENSEIDMIYGSALIDADSFLRLSKDDRYKTKLSPPLSTRMFLLNTVNPVLSELAVRQAINHLINREEISEEIFNGLEEPANTLFAKTIPYCNIDLEPYEYSVEIAKKKLDNAGWIINEKTGIREKDGMVLKARLHYNTDNVVNKTLVEYFQNELAKCGIKINLFSEEKQVHVDRMKNGDFDIITFATLGEPYDPHSYMTNMRIPGVYGDYHAQSGLADKAKLDESILSALTITDEEKRQKLYTYILSYLHKEAVYVPLTYQRNRAVFKKDIKNVTFNPCMEEIPFGKMNRK